MKKIYLLTLGFCLFIGCNENEDIDNNTKDKYNISNGNVNKVNSLIEDFFSDTLNTDVKLEKKEIEGVDSVFEITNKDSLVKHLHQYDSSLKAFDILYRIVCNKNYINKGDEVNYHNDSLSLYNYLESMKKQQQIIAGLYVNTEEKFIGWRVKYEYDVESIGKIGSRSVWDTFILNPDFTKVVNYTSDDWDQITKLRLKINNLKKYLLKREENFIYFQIGIY